MRYIRYLFLYGALQYVAIPVARSDESDLAELSLDQLMQIEVVSASKRSEKLIDIPAAVSVLTGEEIRRSGAQNIPDALRLIPGVMVSQIDSSRWAISIRGASSLFSNKLLVMIDGRTVYTPSFSGTFWDVQDVLLEDVERIEVIRGPGGAVWGANAVNGIINILTKPASETKGTIGSLGLGTEQHYIASARTSTALSDSENLRIYGKSAGYDASQLLNSTDDNQDDWKRNQVGFNYHQKNCDSTITVQGDAYQTRSNVEITYPTAMPPFLEKQLDRGTAQGFNILGKYEADLGSDSNLSAQVYYDKTYRADLVHRAIFETIDADFQHSTKWGSDDLFTWGASYRMILASLSGRQQVDFQDSHMKLPLVSSFVQQDWSFLEGKAHIIFGTKLEVNDQTGFEVQPSIRSVYTISDSSSTWLAFSRAIRTPSVVESSGQVLLPSPQPGLLVSLIPTRGLDSEELYALEQGYRTQLNHSTAVDITNFWMRYYNLTGVAFNGDPYLSLERGAYVSEIKNANHLKNYSLGTELTLTWQMDESTLLRATYAAIFQDPSQEQDVVDAFNVNSSKNDPQNSATLWLSTKLCQGEFDLIGRYVDSIPGYNIDSYIDLTARIGIPLSDSVNLSVVGQNLLQSAHEEYKADYISVTNAQVERGYFAKLDFKLD